MWSNFIDTDVVKFIVNLGTAFVKFADTVGIIPTLAGAFTAYKLAVKGLKDVFDDTNVSAKDFRKTVVEYINDSKNAAATKTEEAAATEIATQADAEESAGNIANATTNQVQAEASNEVAKAKDNEAISVANAANADKLESDTSRDNAAANREQAISGAGADNGGVSTGIGLFAKLAGGAAKAGSAIKVLGVAFGKAALVMVAVKAVTWLLSKGFDALDKNVIHRAENIKKEVESLKSTYEDAKKTFDSNLKTLTTSSDTSLYATLADEFKVLTQGVDQYGNNISLTSDQYERYKSICEQIVGIQPSLARGYDSATKAIGNQANVLSQLIELQKYKARKDADELLSDDAFDKIVENNRNNNVDAVVNDNKVTRDTTKQLYSVLHKKFFKDAKADAETSGRDLDLNPVTNQEFMEYILNKVGIEHTTADLQKYWVQGTNEYDVMRFISDYADQIEQNTDKFGDEYKVILDDTFSEIMQAIESSAEDVKEAQDGLVDSFLLVPQGSKAGQYYDQLNDASKKFVTDWIKNGEQFKTDSNKTKAEATANRDNIIKMIKDLSNGDVKIDFNDKQFTGQDFLDQFYNLDTNINWSQYKEQKQKMLDAFWDAIGGEKNEYGVTKESLQVSFGIEFVNDELETNTKAKETKSQVAEMVGKNETELQDWLNTLPATKVQKFYEIDWNKVDNSGIKSFDDVEAEIDKQIILPGTLSIKPYFDLKDAIDKFNEVLSQTDEIVADNTTVTQDYKDSITSLGFSQEELNDVFDESNPLLVKNAALLRKLVAQKKEEKKATVQAAKAQTQLRYRNTVKQLQQVVAVMGKEYKAIGHVTNATKKSVDVLRSQLTALRQTQREYALLEIQLSGATNAYENFEKAKNLDSKLTYGDSMIEMLNTLNDGFKTGQVGTEAFQAAVEAMVPPSVYEDLDNFNDRMVAIHDYIDKNPLFADWFTIKDGEFSITQENIQSFVDDAKEAGAFTASDENGNFDLGEGVETIDDFVDKINQLAKARGEVGVTKEAVVAMLTEFAKYDATWSDVLSDLTTNKFDKEVNKATVELEKAVKAQDEYIRSGKSLDGEEWKTIQKNVENAEAALNKANAAAQNNASQYNALETIYNSATGKLKLTQEQADALVKSLNLVDKNGELIKINVEDGQVKLTTDQAELLNTKLKGLKEPTIVSVQFDFDTLSKQLEVAKKYINGDELSEEDKTVLFNAGINVDKITPEQLQAKISALPDDQKQVLLDAGINFDGLSKEEIQQKIDEMPDEQKQILLNAGIKVDALTADELTTACNNLITTVEPTLKSISLTYGITKTSEEQQDGTLEKLQDWEVNGMHFTAYAVMDAESKNEVQEEKDKLTEPETVALMPEVDPIYKTVVETELDNLTADRDVNIHTHTIPDTNNTSGWGPYSIVHDNGGLNGTAHASGDWGLKQSEHNSLVGELGTETVKSIAVLIYLIAEIS